MKIPEMCLVGFLELRRTKDRNVELTGELQKDKKIPLRRFVEVILLLSEFLLNHRGNGLREGGFQSSEAYVSVRHSRGNGRQF